MDCNDYTALSLGVVRLFKQGQPPGVRLPRQYLIPGTLLSWSAMLLYRPHRGMLDESMREVVEIVDFAHLVRHMRREVERWYPPDQLPTVENTKVEPYGFDPRIGWDTYLVTVNGQAWGYTDGPLERTANDADQRVP